MHGGRVLQVDTPSGLYERPSQRRVADFIGHSNILQANVVAARGEIAEVEFEGIRMEARRPAVAEIPASGPVSIMIRPEHVLLGNDASTDSARRLRGVVTSRIYEGPNIRYSIKVGGSQLVVEKQNLPGQTLFDAGTEIDVGWTVDACTLLID
jgi:ABC-type Fe3+/spermidine/putrescine transport system ATPase subunit